MGGEVAQSVRVGVDGHRLDRPALLVEHVHISLWRDRSNPAYNMAWSLPVLVALTTQRCHRRGSSSRFFMAFDRDSNPARRNA